MLNGIVQLKLYVAVPSTGGLDLQHKRIKDITNNRQYC